MTNQNMRISILSFFYIALVLHGLHRMSGLFIIELSKIKSMTHQDAVIPFIYCWAMSKIVGSFSAFLTDDKSSEIAIFCGALLCIIGSALCILDTDVTAITVFWGFIFGSGYGLASPHLTKDFCGFKFFSNVDSNKLSASFGIAIMPFLLNILIFHYGFQGSFIMFSGIMLQYIPFALAAAYNMEIRIPDFKWRVRKKNSQYPVSEQKGSNAVSIENFKNSLEPDFVLKDNENDNYYDKINTDSPSTFSKKNFCALRKRSETKGNDLQGLEINRKVLQNHVTSIPEKNICKKIGKISEENFSDAYVGLQCKENEKAHDLTFETTNNIFALNKNSFKNSKHHFNLKCDISKHISQNHTKKESSNIFFENNIVNNKTILADTCIKRTPLMIVDDSKDYKKHEIRENVENEQRISLSLGQTKTSTPHKTQLETLLGKETPILSQQLVQNTPAIIIPLDIKIHVEEYTFTVDREYRESFDSSYSEEKINDEVNNSQSETLKESKYCKFSNSNSHKNTPEHFDSKSNSSNFCSLANKSKFNIKTFSGKINNSIVLNTNKNELQLKFIRILKFLGKLMSPVCLCILMFTIVFETSLIILLTNIGYFVNSSDRVCYEFKWILVAFGIGGLFGKLCCCKISRTMSEKAHSFGVVLFLLNGLSIAGVLYSPNQSWLAGFYSILGALEGGISYILSKFILDYTHKQVHHMMPSMQSFFSGIVVICLPSAIGLLSDEMDDYEFILQTLSCLSVMSALITYLLPYLRSISNEINHPVC